MLSSPYILLFATFGVAIAEPVKLELRDSPAAATTDAEEGFPWVIPEMSLRFHTEYTGFKGPWPVDTKFEDSSIHFKILFPEGSAECSATWPISYAELHNGTLPRPDQWFDCTHTREKEEVSFGMRRYTGAPGTRAETDFVLGIFRSFKGRPYYVRVPVTAMGKEPTDYLTCVHYEPYSQMDCKMHSFYDNGRNITIGRAEVDSTETFLEAVRRLKEAYRED